MAKLKKPGHPPERGIDTVIPVFTGGNLFRKVASG
jgi:hypothetical protein